MHLRKTEVLPSYGLLPGQMARRFFLRILESSLHHGPALIPSRVRVRLCQRVLPAGSPGGAEPHTPRETGQKQRGEGPAAPTVSSHTPAPDKPLQRRASPTRCSSAGTTGTFVRGSGVPKATVTSVRTL